MSALEMNAPIQVIHVYEHDKRNFEVEVNEALRRILERGAVVADIQYAIDSSTTENARGGYGALIVFEQGGDD